MPIFNYDRFSTVFAGKTERYYFSVRLTFDICNRRALSVRRPTGPFRRGALRAAAAFLAAFALILLAACSGQEDQREFEREALQPPQGFTRTDGNGNIEPGGEDPDDWRTSPFFQGLVDVDPAFPNPVLSTDNVHIRFEITTVDANINRVTAFVLHEDGTMPDLDSVDSSPLQFGYHFLNFPAQRLARFQDPRGLHRILLYDGRGNIVSYGDIMVE